VGHFSHAARADARSVGLPPFNRRGVPAQNRRSATTPGATSRSRLGAFGLRAEDFRSSVPATENPADQPGERVAPQESEGCGIRATRRTPRVSIVGPGFLRRGRRSGRSHRNGDAEFDGRSNQAGSALRASLFQGVAAGSWPVVSWRRVRPSTVVLDRRTSVVERCRLEVAARSTSPARRRPPVLLSAGNIFT
jgi:hypothetical protein